MSNESKEVTEVTEVKKDYEIIATKEFTEMSKQRLFNIVISGQGAVTLDDAITNVPFTISGIYINSDNDGEYALFGQGDNIIKTRSGSLITALRAFLGMFGQEYSDTEVKLIRKKAANSENRYYTLEVCE